MTPYRAVKLLVKATLPAPVTEKHSPPDSSWQSRILVVLAPLAEILAMRAFVSVEGRKVLVPVIVCEPAIVTASPAGWRPVAVLGTVLGITIAAEVTAQMWSARFLQQQSAQLAALAGAGAALFSGCQSMLRLMGDALRQRVGDGRLITVSLLVAALGFATVAAAGVPWPWLSALHGFGPAVAGFALVGLGTACVVPCLFALIARQAPDRAAAALGTASLVAGLIRLPAPLLLGWVVSLWSDAAGFAGMALALLLGALLARRGMARGGPSGMAGAAAPVRQAAGYSAGP